MCLYALEWARATSPAPYSDAHADPVTFGELARHDHRERWTRGSSWVVRTRVAVSAPRGATPAAGQLESARAVRCSTARGRVQFGGSRTSPPPTPRSATRTRSSA